uniref:Putative ribonuclease H-like domain-containing protein n=1 Tax=Tanacetum cinerariifolium TaxID=118510 RepID=A0A6L2MBT3_TANCI|nr:putative ribonuclease H-like domain-containing protein [Tanacetum cinerariifolium]
MPLSFTKEPRCPPAIRHHPVGKNGCAFYGLMSDDLIQHLKDFLKIVDSIDLNDATINTTHLRLLSFSLCDQAINWLDRLPAGSISTWDDLTIRSFRMKVVEPLTIHTLPSPHMAYLYRNALELMLFKTSRKCTKGLLLLVEDQLEILGESLSQEDINLKFLRSLPSEWRTYTLIWRNKADLEDHGLDDLFNNLKIYEAEIKSSSSTSHNTQNIALVSLQNTDSTNALVSAVPSFFAASPKAPASILPNVDNLSKVEKENESAQQYVLLPLWSTGSKDPQNIDADAAFDVKENESEVYVSPSSSDKTKKHDDKTKREAKGKSHVDLSTGVRNLSDEFEDFSSNSTNKVNATSAPVTAVRLNSTNSTNSFNAVGPSNDAVNMPALEDIVYLDDEEDVGAEAAFSNLETSITFSPIPTTRVHKDHPVTQIIGDLTSAHQTRSMARMVTKQGFEDLDYPDKVYKVVKALYGLHQAPRAWYETLANYLLENGFQRGKIDQTLFIKKQKGDILLVQVYVDDIIFGSTNKELCQAFEKLMKDKFQMSSMRELTFFLGLQVKQKDNEIFIRQDKYVAKILRKFGLTDGKSASTPIDTEKPLLKDPDGEDVDVHI